MYTNRVFGTAKCVLFIEVSSSQGVLNKRHTCTYNAHENTCVYSTLAKLVVEEEKKENPDPIHHTRIAQHVNTKCIRNTSPQQGQTCSWDKGHPVFLSEPTCLR